MELKFVYEEGFGSDIKEFYSTQWPSANLEVFGFTDQSKWKMEEHLITARLDNNTIVGVAQFRIIGGVGYLSTLLIEEDFRGEGIVGISLLDKFESIAKNKGCHKFSLKSYKNSRASNFFAKQGYELEGVLKRDIHMLDWVMMAKYIK